MPTDTSEIRPSQAELSDAEMRHELEKTLTPAPKQETLGVPRRITTEAEAHHLMDAAAPMIGQVKPETTPKEGFHKEAGIEMEDKIPVPKLIERAQELITIKNDLTKPGGANELAAGLEDIMKRAA